MMYFPGRTQQQALVLLILSPLIILAEYHLEAKDWEAYLMLLFYRGKVDDMIQFASESDLLDPYLLSLSPSVSFKWVPSNRPYYLTNWKSLHELQYWAVCFECFFSWKEAYERWWKNSEVKGFSANCWFFFVLVLGHAWFPYVVLLYHYFASYICMYRVVLWNPVVSYL